MEGLLKVYIPEMHSQKFRFCVMLESAILVNIPR